MPLQKKTIKYSSNNAWLAAAGFALIWLLTLFLWWKKHHAIIETSDPWQAKDIVINWGRKLWPHATILNLTDLIALTTDVNLKRLIQQLSQALYSTDKQKWDSEEFWQYIKSVKIKTKKDKRKKDHLPPIH